LRKTSFSFPTDHTQGFQAKSSQFIGYKKRKEKYQQEAIKKRRNRGYKSGWGGGGDDGE